MRLIGLVIWYLELGAWFSKYTFDQITSTGRNFYEWYARARLRPDFEFVVGRTKAMRVSSAT
jgi:hypothetical protein